MLFKLELCGVLPAILAQTGKKKNCLVYKPVFGVHHPAKLVLHEEVVWLMYSRILCVCIKRCQQLSNEKLMLPGLKCDSLPADSMASKQEMRHTKTNVIFWGFEIDSKMFGSHVVFSFSFISIDPSLPPHVHVCIHVELYLYIKPVQVHAFVENACFPCLSRITCLPCPLQLWTLQLSLSAALSSLASSKMSWMR